MLQTPRSLRGMVTAPHHLASAAGLDILKAGGTAIEAAVATAAVLAVVYPHMNSIGGDGFWLTAVPGGPVAAIDACGGAAGRCDPGLYAGHDSIPWRGPLAANTVAGAVSGWAAALATSATWQTALPVERLLESAVHYAEQGCVVTAGHAAVAVAVAELGEFAGYRAAFTARGEPLVEGALLRQPALGRTLRRLASEGLEGFYAGALAADIAADLAVAGSPVAAADLARHRATRPVPLHATVGDARVYNLPPPTQGVASLLILALFDRIGAVVRDDFAYVHALVEATKVAFAWRDVHVGDPAGADAQALLDDAGALDAMAAGIDPLRARPWPAAEAGGDTVWFGAVDAAGRAASVIQSTYFEFGSGIVLPQTGITWQNRGASFSLRPGPRMLRPFAKPFHTLNPALARFEDGRTMVYGTMGGEGQPQTQAAVFTRVRAGVALQAAVSAPRWLLGRTWGEASVSLKLEDRLDPALYAALRVAGHDVELVAPFSAVMGHAGALVCRADGTIEGAADPRSDGAVAAW